MDSAGGAFHDTAVIELSERFVCVKLNVATDEGRRAAGEFAVRAVPSIRFLNPQGEDIRELVGFQEPAAFATAMREVLDGLGGGAGGGAH